jgi:hypothetical protein
MYDRFWKNPATGRKLTWNEIVTTCNSDCPTASMSAFPSQTVQALMRRTDTYYRSRGWRAKTVGRCCPVSSFSRLCSPYSEPPCLPRFVHVVQHHAFSLASRSPSNTVHDNVGGESDKVWFEGVCVLLNHTSCRQRVNSV